MLKEVQQNLDLGMILVTHDLSVVARICDDVAVMYAGRIVEHAPITEIFDRPRHPYTQALMLAVPRLNASRERLNTIPGQPPDVRRLGSGCPFVPRCGKATDRCRQEYPPAATVGPAHTVSCWEATS